MTHDISSNCESQQSTNVLGKTDYDVAFHVLQEWHDETSANEAKVHYTKRNAAINVINTVKQNLYRLLKA